MHLTQSLHAYEIGKRGSIEFFDVMESIAFEIKANAEFQRPCTVLNSVVLLSLITHSEVILRLLFSGIANHLLLENNRSLI